MSDFTNITYDTDWIYADVLDCDSMMSGKVKVHRTQEIFETDCIDISQSDKEKVAKVMRKDADNGNLSQDNSFRVVFGAVYKRI